MINDHISDMFARLANAYAVRKKTVTLPHTKVVEAVARVMLNEKYLSGVEVVTPSHGHKTLQLTLSYKDGVPALSHVRRISKPGVRQYSQIQNIKPILSGMGIAIISTSKGIMSSRAAKLAHLGGEVLAQLW